MITPGKALQAALTEMGEDLAHRDAEPDKESIREVALPFFQDLCSEDPTYAAELLLEDPMGGDLFHYLKKGIQEVDAAFREEERWQAKVDCWNSIMTDVIASVVHAHGEELQELLVEATDDAHHRYREEMAVPTYTGRGDEEWAA